MNVSLIWITRQSDQEDAYLAEYLQELRGLVDVEKIIVGHTNLPPTDFKYIPFFEHGLDGMGLICHKKNIGVLASTKNICIVMHADTAPEIDTLLGIEWGIIGDNDILCPIAITPQGNRGLTWCYKFGRHKPALEPFDYHSYISGACLIAKRSTLLKHPWNQNLRHNESEDVEMSDRLYSLGMNMVCQDQLKFKIKTSQ